MIFVRYEPALQRPRGHDIPNLFGSLCALHFFVLPRAVIVVLVQYLGGVIDGCSSVC
jgi:hypothetical protein